MTNYLYLDKPNQYNPNTHIPVGLIEYHNDDGTVFYGGNNVEPVKTNTVGNLFTGFQSKLNNYIQNQKQDPYSLYNRGLEAKNQALDGWGKLPITDRANLVLGTVGTLVNAYNAHKTNKLAKQQLEHQINNSNRNWDIQRKMTNSQLEDRQIRRVEEAKANGRTTMSVGDYMRKYGV